MDTSPGGKHGGAPVGDLRAMVALSGLDRGVLAGRLGLSRAHLDAVLDGRVPPGPGLVRKLARECGADPDDRVPGAAGSGTTPPAVSGHSRSETRWRRRRILRAGGGAAAAAVAAVGVSRLPDWLESDDRARTVDRIDLPDPTVECVVDGVALCTGFSRVRAIALHDGDDGTEKWRLDAPRSSSVFVRCEAESDLVHVLHAPPGMTDSRLYALDRSTGRARWWRLLPMGLLSLAVLDGRTYTGSVTSETMYAHDAASGAPLWESGKTGLHLMGRSQAHTPDAAVFTGRSAGGTTAEVVSMRPADGEVLWRLKSTGREIDLASGTDTVFAAMVEGVRALDAVTGEVRWQTTGRAAAAVCLAGGVLLVRYATTADGSEATGIEALDPATGRRKWRALGAVRAMYGVLYEDGTLYVGTDKGLHAVDLDTGKRGWVYRGHRAVTPFALDGRHLIAGEGPGGLVILRR